MVLKITYYILHIIGFWYWQRLCVLSDFFTTKVKIGEAGELWHKYVYYILLLIFSILYVKYVKTNERYIFLILSILYIVCFIYGRYSGYYLTFEEYVGKS